jgi:hypothetical protein
VRYIVTFTEPGEGAQREVHFKTERLARRVANILIEEGVSAYPSDVLGGELEPGPHDLWV